MFIINIYIYIYMNDYLHTNCKISRNVLSEYFCIAVEGS